jgi:serine/threonine protein phosphatase PrpC
MASDSSESKLPPAGSLQSMLARLRGMVQALKTLEEERDDLLPTWDTAAGPGALPAETGLAVPAAEPALEVAEMPSTTEPLRPEPTATAEAPEVTPAPEVAASVSSWEESGEGETQAPRPEFCPYCQAPRTGTEVYCANCGWIFPAPAPAPAAGSADNAAPRLHGRYELGERIGERGNVVRYRGLDHGANGGGPTTVIILRSPLPETAEAVAAADLPAAEVSNPSTNGENSPACGESAAALPQAEAVPLQPAWPSVDWECALLEHLQHPVLPRLLDAFVDGGFEYVIEELPVGRSLWDAWEDPAATAEQRFAWLKQIAGALYHLNQSHALLEALRPDILVLSPEGQPRITDLSDLLPLPLPPNPPVRATYYTAPELVLASDKADGRASIYSFGAMLYALHLGRELTELDFELQGVPKPFLERFPDVHPLFGRLISKTFCRDANGRFPTEEAARKDPCGFAELINTLEVCRQNLDSVRLEIAAWTTTGMVRSGNEDAFAVLHATEAHENQLGEVVLVLLADGMGGYEAGEVAAAMAMQALRSYLVRQKPFAAFAGGAVASSSFDESKEGPSRRLDVESWKSLLAAALQDANRQVYAAAHTRAHSEGMGCTAEVVYVDGRHVVVGHVGDSRTYHLHQGRLLQLTRDQTWVQRMVELGVLSPQEAETHPRRSELQQAIGGEPEVRPALYDSTVKPGDWVVVCSDGLSNHLSSDTLQGILQAAPSAEWAARRLVNAVNLAGATDNATVVVIRAT